MNKSTLVLTSLVMALSSLFFLSEVRGKLNGMQEYKSRAQFWKGRVAREQLKKLIVEGRFADFKQDVALLIPPALEGIKSKKQKKQLRQLASVIPQVHEADIQTLSSASQLLSKGKKYVQKRKYKKAVSTLKRLVNKYPDSLHIVEAHYLIVEAYSQSDKNINALTWIDKMVELFPANRLTGYALLKAGGLYELDGRSEDAIRIYRTIVAVYSDKRLVAKAQKAVNGLEL